jgi:hypothetical protein
MAGANALSATAIAVELTSGATVAFAIETSNDRQNWSSLGTMIALSDVGISEDQETGISATYVRCNAVVLSTEAATAIVSFAVHRQWL